MAKSTVKSSPKTLDIIKNDPWLKDYEAAIVGRHRHAEDKIAELTQNGKCSLSDFASGYLYFGLHRTATGWVFREWAPHATEIYLIGDFNDWKESPKYQLKRIKDTGNWEIKLRGKALKHGDLYKLKYIGKADAANVFRHGAAAWCKTNRPKSSVHRSGHPNSLTYGKRRLSAPIRLPC